MFSANGEYVMSNSKDAQILFWRTKDGARQQAMHMFRDTKWQMPWTCVLGWPVIGIWGDPAYDQTDVNSVCQSSAPDAGYIAIGDDYGKLKLFQFPSPFLDPPCDVHGGHAAHVTKVKFSRSNVLVALGGDDHSISQWSLDRRRPSSIEPPRTVVHPWEQLEEADIPTERFSYLGRAGRLGYPRQDMQHENLRDGGYNSEMHLDGSISQRDNVHGMDHADPFHGLRPPARAAGVEQRAASAPRQRHADYAVNNRSTGVGAAMQWGGGAENDRGIAPVVRQDRHPPRLPEQQPYIQEASQQPSTTAGVVPYGGAARQQNLQESEPHTRRGRGLVTASQNRSRGVGDALRWD